MSADDDRALGTFPKLTVNNYRQWEARIKNFLTAKELWGTIEPIGKSKTVDKDIVRNAKAKEAIWRTIDDANLSLVGTLGTAAEVWKELKTHHGVHQGQSVYRTLNSLFSLKMSHDGSLREHIKSFMDLRNDLSIAAASDADFKLSDAVQASILLGSLPSSASWKIWVSSFYTAHSKPTVSEVLIRLDQEITDKGKVPKKEAEGAMRAEGNKKWVRYNPNAKCAGCGRNGWTKPNCNVCNGCSSTSSGSNSTSSKPQPSSKTSLRKKEKSLKAELEKLRKKMDESDSDESDDERVERGKRASVGDKTVYALASEVVLKVNSGEVSQDKWAWDSGCSRHMSPCRERFSGLTEIDPVRIEFAGEGQYAIARHSGTLVAPQSNGDTVEFKNALYVPELSSTLLSLGQVLDNGAEVRITGDSLKVFKDGHLAARSTRSGKSLWFMLVSPYPKPTASANLADVNVWHRRFGHLHEAGVRKACKEGGITLSSGPFKFCDECAVSKMHRTPFNRKKTGSRSRTVLGRIHLDTAIPNPIS